MLHPFLQLRNVQGFDAPRAMIEGTTIPVARIYGWYISGTSVETIEKRYPKLSKAMLFSALSYAFLHEAEMNLERAHENKLLAAMTHSS